MSAVMTSPADEKQIAPKPDAEVQQLDESDIQTAMHEMVTKAISFVDGELGPQRAEAEKYFKGELFGNEEDGRSKVVMTELRDAILMILPSLLRMFFGAEPAVEYGPSTAKQVKMAEQVTRYVLDAILGQDNSGFLVFHDWFMDALLKRIGVVKYWQDDGEESREFSIAYQTMDAITLLSQDDTIEIQDVSPCDAAPPRAGLFDVEYKQTRKWSRTRVVCIPPEEYLYSKGARTASNDPAAPGVAQFVGHRTELTRSQLRAMGVTEEDIDAHGFPDSALSASPEEVERQRGNVQADEPEAAPEANHKALWIEGYPYLDLDGDGIAELCRVTMLGPAHTIVGEPEPCSRRPFAVLTPAPIPHVIEGQSIADYTMDLQKIVSMIWRSILDSLVLAINPRIGYVEGEASLEDILNMQLAAPIRMRSQGAIQPIEHNFVGREGLGVLAALSEVKENRVGVTKASAGLDAGALQSSSAAAVSAAVTNAQQHIEMIARVFAETGVKALFRGILELVVENPDAERMVRVNGEYVPMDPRAWDANLDVRVNVAIGAGTLQEKIMTLSETLADMKETIATMGPSNPIVSMRQYRDTLVKRLKLRGRMDAESFFLETDPNWQPPPPPPGAGDPNMVIAQAEAAKAAAEVQTKENNSRLEAAKHEINISRQQEDIRLREKEMELVDAREREKLEAELVLQVMEMNLKYKTEITVEQVKAEMAAKQQHRVVKVQHNDAGQVIGLEVQQKGSKE
jgi:hypothetical protein